MKSTSDNDNLKMRGRKISLFGNFGSLNLGNEWTLQAIIHNIRTFLPDADLQCICTDPDDVLPRHSVHAIPMASRNFGIPVGKTRWVHRNLLWRLLRAAIVRIPTEIIEWVKAFKALRERDVLLLTGTGMLTDCTERPLGLPYQIFKWTFIAKVCRLRVFFVSVGVEPIRLRLTKLFLRTSLRMADYVCFRDYHSRDYLAGLGLADKASIYPDLAFSFPEEVLPHRTTRTSGKSVIGVGVFDYEGRGQSGGASRRSYEDYIRKLSDFVAWLVERGHPVRVLIGDIRYDKPVKADLRASLAVRGIEYGKCNITDEPVYSVTNMLDEISAVDMVVATRYHNIVAALALHKPVLSISYERKNEALMSDIGLSEFCQTIDQLDVDKLCEQFVDLEKSADLLQARIERKMRNYRKALAEQYAMLFASDSLFARPTL